MLDFIDTSLFKNGEKIGVVIYSDSKDRAKRKIDSLLKGENVLELIENYHETRAIVEKGDITIHIRTLPLSTHMSGIRSAYAVVDSEIFGHKNSGEIYNNLKYTVRIYLHLLKDDKQILSNIILF